jgi:hypothetical protein
VDLSSNAQHCGACGLACTPGLACQGGVCVNPCEPGLYACPGGCVDVNEDTSNCGGCGIQCAPGEFCTAGVCSATCAGTVCPGAAGNECVTLTTDADHCGACNNACGSGFTCEAGACVLDCGTLTECGDACVDVSSDAAHCGACGTECGAGQMCEGGACVCAGGLELCGEACIDTSMDPEHCGDCDRVCSGGGLCDAGNCVGPDGCTEIAVEDLVLSAVDIYQTIQIPIMEGGSAIPALGRNAHVVAGRRTIFRIHVDPGAGWTPREISARVELTDVDAPASDESEVFFDRITPFGPSSDADPDTTFNVEVPAEAITADTRYAVTLVECDGATAAPAHMTSTAGARFPVAGHEPLEARAIGPLRLHIIPIGGVDTSEQRLQVYEDRLEAIYPVPDVIVTVGEPSAATASSMCSLLAWITAIRSQDGAPSHVYYYGLTPSTVGGQSGCSSTGGSQASVGWAAGFNDNPEIGASTMCHELGHAHGRLHAPCNVRDPDPRYPYLGADIGMYGYDFRTGRFLGPERKDMMSYCPDDRPTAWVSDYNYQAILERAEWTNQFAEIPHGLEAALAPEEPWRLLVLDSAGLHWIEEPLMVHGTPDGDSLMATIHDEHGPVHQVQVYVQELHDGVREGAFMLILPEPDASWDSIEVPGLLPRTPF